MTTGPNAVRSADSLRPEDRSEADRGPQSITPIARLAALRDEAAEVAELANMLGRVPYLAAGLAVAAGLKATMTHVPLAPLLAFLALIGAGLLAMVRSYRQYISAPFELSTLQSFSRSLEAEMLYFGFAWGSASFLLFWATGGYQDLALSAAVCALALVALRSLAAVAYFSVPVSFFFVAAAAWGGNGGARPGMLAIIVLGILPISVAYFMGKYLRRTGSSNFADHYGKP